MRVTTGSWRAVGVALAAVVVGSGVWLTRTGRPYEAGALAVHKLAALAAVAAAGISVYRDHQSSSISAPAWAAIGAGAPLVVASFVTGGVMAVREAVPAWFAWLHRSASWLAAAVAVAGVFLAGRG